MIVGIIGLGEVGSAIKKLCLKKHRVFSRSLDRDELKGKQVDVLHLCYPYSLNFVKIALASINELKPKLVVIDSTVKPGTTLEIFKKSKIPVVHAPIIGKHPRLYEYLFAMEKVIGPASPKAYRLAQKHFEELGVKTVRFRSPLEAEMGKLFCTTYYGWNIIFSQYLYRVCRQQQADYDQVYVKFNQIYNQGYAKTLPEVRRPVLKYVPGPIGGHCVIPNTRIIKAWLNDELSQFLLSQNEKAKQDCNQEKE